MREIDKKIQEIIRVNHAGEFGAQKIYNSQIRNIKKKNLHKKLVKIAKEEQQHFDYFNNLIIKNRVRPTAMSPLWSFFGTALGVISSKLGENYVHACTESVEEVIVKHYKDQLNFLKNKKIKGDLRQKIKRFCDDEDSHRKDASESALPSDSYGVTIFKKITKVGTRLAIGISKKI
mgnify:FL=1